MHKRLITSHGHRSQCSHVLTEFWLGVTPVRSANWVGQVRAHWGQRIPYALGLNSANRFRCKAARQHPFMKAGDVMQDFSCGCPFSQLMLPVYGALMKPLKSPKPTHLHPKQTLNPSTLNPTRGPGPKSQHGSCQEVQSHHSGQEGATGVPQGMDSGLRISSGVSLNPARAFGRLS